MLVIFHSEVTSQGPEVRRLLAHIEQYPGVTARVHSVHGAIRDLTEVYLIGPTDTVSREAIEGLPGVERVVRISEKYRLIGRHRGQVDAVGFVYQGTRFDQDSCHIFAGLCAVDTRENVAAMMHALRRVGLTTTRMGAYKPR